MHQLNPISLWFLSYQGWLLWATLLWNQCSHFLISGWTSYCLALYSLSVLLPRLTLPFNWRYFNDNCIKLWYQTSGDLLGLGKKRLKHWTYTCTLICGFSQHSFIHSLLYYLFLSSITTPQVERKQWLECRCNYIPSANYRVQVEDHFVTDGVCVWL